MGFYCAGNGFPTNAQIIKERKAFRAKPLPTNRPRALTSPLDDDAQNQTDRAQKHILSRIIKKKQAQLHQWTSTQKDSLLITRLPYEVRRLIWRYLLCGQHLHLVRAPKRLLAIRCDEEEPIGDFSHRCWGYTSIRVRFGPRGAVGYYKGQKNGAQCETANLLSILRACRLVYSETIDLLYNGNTFDFNSADTILSFSQTVLRSRLNFLRVVRLQYWFSNFLYIRSNRCTLFPSSDIPSDSDQLIENPKLVAPFDAKTWEQACSVLASLSGLQELYIHLDGTPLTEPDLEPLNTKPILGSLMQIRQQGLLDFEVSVPWKEDPEKIYVIKGAPFRLVSRDVDSLCL